MEVNEEKVGKIYYAINILRKTTKIVKVYPFLYTVILIACMFANICLANDEPITDEQFIDSQIHILDQLIFVSPLIVGLFFYLSYTLKFCNWYRFQCALPLIPQVIDYADTYLFDLGTYSIFAINNVTILLAVATLINAYFVFVRPTRTQL